MIQIDMPMPKCCYECFALDENGDYPFCLISQDQRGYTFNTREKRMPTCPLKAREPRVMTLEEAPAVDAIPVEWLDAQIRGYASALMSTELHALLVVKRLWEKEQEAQDG